MRIKLPLRREYNAGRAPGLAYDCELASRVKEGDRQALSQLVDRHIGRVNTYLLHRLGDGHDDTVRRVLATTLAQALRNLDPYCKGTASTPMDLWLIRLAERNLARIRTATAKESAKTQSSVLGPQSPAPGPPSDLARLRTAMSTLPERHNFVLALAVLEQMPAADIAYTLGTTPSGALRRVRAALKRLGKALDKQEEEAG